MNLTSKAVDHCEEKLREAGLFLKSDPTVSILILTFVKKFEHIIRKIYVFTTWKRLLFVLLCKIDCSELRKCRRDIWIVRSTSQSQVSKKHEI